MPLNSGVASICQQGDQSEGAKRPSGGGHRRTGPFPLGGGGGGRNISPEFRILARKSNMFG